MSTPASTHFAQISTALTSRSGRGGPTCPAAAEAKEAAAAAASARRCVALAASSPRSSPFGERGGETIGEDLGDMERGDGCGVTPRQRDESTWDGVRKSRTRCSGSKCARADATAPGRRAGSCSALHPPASSTAMQPHTEPTGSTGGGAKLAAPDRRTMQ